MTKKSITASQSFRCCSFLKVVDLDGGPGRSDASARKRCPGAAQRGCNRRQGELRHRPSSGGLLRSPKTRSRKKSPHSRRTANRATAPWKSPGWPACRTDPAHEVLRIPIRRCSEAGRYYDLALPTPTYSSSSIPATTCIGASCSRRMPSPTSSAPWMIPARWRSIPTAAIFPAPLADHRSFPHRERRAQHRRGR